MAVFEYLPLGIRSGVRALFWRAGRKFYCYARGDLPNQPDTNGEYWLLGEFVGRSKDALVLIDVGANKGDWTLQALEIAARRNSGISVYAFEPCASTRALLSQRLSCYEGVRISGNALSSSEGEVCFYINENGAGTNSLSEISGSQRELVTMTTLDSFLSEGGIGAVDMLKIDTEGFDFEVLKGSERALTAGLIELVQFEYNWRWLINHVALRDVIEFIKDKPYRLGKLVGDAIEIFDQWHFEMDRYFESNYVLIRTDSRLLDIANVVHFDKSNCARRVESRSNV
jgi:FkbM family methyltransferase